MKTIEGRFLNIDVGARAKQHQSKYHQQRRDATVCLTLVSISYFCCHLVFAEMALCKRRLRIAQVASLGFSAGAVLPPVLNTAAISSIGLRVHANGCASGTTLRTRTNYVSDQAQDVDNLPPVKCWLERGIGAQYAARTNIYILPSGRSIFTQSGLHVTLRA